MTKISYDAQEKLSTPRVRAWTVYIVVSRDILISLVARPRARAYAYARDGRKSIFRLDKIWQTKLVAARRRYYRGTETLLTFFSPNEIMG